ncbi:MAG TPA: class I poly(R)-hydroxyalkanoic acid synthase [Burkholderiales bacterium]|nr:class I poly(R)-hydroxyalkanoic acid synthase [Burkholderiales bacterium]
MSTSVPTRVSQHIGQTPELDPIEVAETCAEIAQKSGRIIGEFISHQVANGASALSDGAGAAEVFSEAAIKLFADPAALAAMQFGLWRDCAELWQNSMLRFCGCDAPPVIAPERHDRRFKGEDWQQNPFFDYLKQSYLLVARRIQQAVSAVNGSDAHTAKKIDFYTRQYINALSPSNFLLTNPEVLRETIDSRGRNLVRGLDNLIADFERGQWRQLRVKMTDPAAFEVGRNLATTPGKIVFQNDLMQLIQYAPLTAEVHRRPLLIIPPWINKYYILDMREDNSFVRWAVAQGHTVFVISWANPGASYADKTFDDYLREGPLAALDAIELATGEREVNAVGYCLGGTLLAILLAYLAAKSDDRIRSATLFATMIDFSAPGELDVFIDEAQVAALEKKMDERGYLDGAEMAATFNLLRANDLIWSFVVNNYLLGRQPLPFDLLYWNSDSTRMPAAMHSFYLRNMYLKNRLREPRGITLAGVPIDLSQVRTPLYFVSTLEDHISPWPSTYAGARLFPGEVRFVLGGSGHIAGIVNPPAAGKYQYWTRDALDAEPQQWLAHAERHAGSWWLDWAQWVAPHAAEQVAARAPGAGRLPALEDAPGAYVKVRLDTPSPAAMR